jgi:sec-independent protein translocase protein TatC
MNSFKKISLAEHFQDLKKRILYSVIGFLISFIFSYYYSEELFVHLLAPLAKIMEGENHKMIYTGLTEAFFTYLKLSIYMGILLSLPIILSQIYLFIAPALYNKERRTLLPYLIISPLLFILGTILLYNFIIPTAWKFFLSFEKPVITGGIAIQLEAKISEYLSLVMDLIFAFGLAFQMPILLCLLTEIGIITPNFLMKKRKFAIILIFIIAAIITPPDVISQIGLAIPMMILYELSIVSCKLIYKKGQNKNA